MATSGWSTYQLRRQLFSIGEDFWIQNAQGENVYKLDGKVLVLTQTFSLQDINGNEVARMQAEMLTDEVLLLCIAISIDEMSERDRR